MNSEKLKRRVDSLPYEFFVLSSLLMLNSCNYSDDSIQTQNVISYAPPKGRNSKGNTKSKVNEEAGIGLGGSNQTQNVISCAPPKAQNTEENTESKVGEKAGIGLGGSNEINKVENSAQIEENTELGASKICQQMLEVDKKMTEKTEGVITETSCVMNTSERDNPVFLNRKRNNLNLSNNEQNDLGNKSEENICGQTKKCTTEYRENDRTNDIFITEKHNPEDRKYIEHRKYVNDYSETNSIFTGIKRYLINTALINFINGKLPKEYGDLKLKKIKGKVLESNKRELMLGLVNMKLKDLFSKYNDHNKELITNLLKNKKGEYEAIFDLTFIQCLHHFGGKEKIEQLQGLQTLDQYIEAKKKDFEDEKYARLFKDSVDAFEFYFLCIKK